jgi:hypothetical protein
MTISRTAWLAIASIAVFAGVFVTSTARARFIWDDDGIYISTAHSLSEGRGYRLQNLPGAPPQTKYPPLYPALLSLAWPRGMDYTDVAPRLKMVNAVGFALVVFLTGLLACRGNGGNAGAGIAAALLTASSPALASHAEQLVSDVWFTVFLLGACSFPRAARWTRTEAVWACLLAGFSTLTRTVGLAVGVGTIFGISRRSERWSTLAGASAFAALTAPWAIWRLAVASPASPLLRDYLTYERSLWLRIPEMPALAAQLIFRNALSFAAAASAVFGTLSAPVTLLVVTIAGLGTWRHRDAPWIRTCLFITVPYLAVVIGHPYPMIRYLVPLVPFLAVFFVRGLLDIRSRSVGNAGQVVATVGLATLGLWLALNITGLLRFRDVTTHDLHGGFGRPMPFAWSGFEEAFAYIRKEAATTAVLASPHDALYAVYTNHPTVKPWFHLSDLYEPAYGLGPYECEDVEALGVELKRLNVSYLIVDAMLPDVDSGYGASCLRQLRDRHGSDWELVYRTSDKQHLIYRDRRSSQ